MSEEKKNNPIPELTDSDLRAAEAFLRAHDPALAFPNGFSAKRGRRVVWCMEHPVLATILIHHRLTAFVGAAVLLALIIAACFTIRAQIARRERLMVVELIPDPFADEAADLPEGDADPPMALPDGDVPDVAPDLSEPTTDLTVDPPDLDFDGAGPDGGPAAADEPPPAAEGEPDA